ncbi:hypothetical protein [Schleiferilactobacillus harbinensis]|uniref:hypothetical protein n=1 Tax=Schleiferilactobacillus harbinensis TaxID=304207 RepID=UPI0007B7E2BA|nr:hypothetical protein [Schleiferilactobacillus harbinensis]
MILKSRLLGRNAQNVSPDEEDTLNQTTQKLRTDLERASIPTTSQKTAKIIRSRKFQLRMRIAAVCILAPITLWLELTVQLFGILLLGCLVGTIAITFVVIDEIISTVGRWRKKRQ